MRKFFKDLIKVVGYLLLITLVLVIGLGIWNAYSNPTASEAMWAEFWPKLGNSLKSVLWLIASLFVLAYQLLSITF